MFKLIDSGDWGPGRGHHGHLRALGVLGGIAGGQAGGRPLRWPQWPSKHFLPVFSGYPSYG